MAIHEAAVGNHNKDKLGLRGLYRAVFNWYPSELPGKERKLLFKLDVSILVYCSLSFFLKYLDQANITNAYVSGLSDEFNLVGNELNYLNVCYYVALVVFQIPGMLILTRPKLARWFLPTLELLWGIATFAQSRATNIQQLYALRFLVGLFEAPCFAGTNYILGSWYNGGELFQRCGMWYICDPLGGMVSGYLQAAAYANLNGVNGMEGWRWLFVIDGIFTVPIALIGFLVFPGIPGSPRTFYLTEDDVVLARERMERARIEKPQKINLDTFKRTFSSWHIYAFVFAYTGTLLAAYPGNYMALWLEAEGYSIEQINEIPTGMYGIYIFTAWFGCTLCAIYNPALIFSLTSIPGLFAACCFIVWNVPKTLKFVCWYLMGSAGCSTPIMYSVMNTICKGDSEERAIIAGAMITIGYALDIWVPLLAFPTSGPHGATRWDHGWPLTLSLWTAAMLVFIAAVVAYNRKEKRRLAAGTYGDESLSGSGFEEVPGGVVPVQVTADEKS